MKSDFENLTINGIQSLLYILATIESEDRNYIRSLYENNSVGFEATVSLLKNIKLLKCDENSIIRTPRFHRLASKTLIQDISLNNYLIDLIINSHDPMSTEIKKYLARFRLTQEALVYKPLSKQRLQDSEIRNLLIEIGIVEHIKANKWYRIADDYIHLFADKAHTVCKSPQELAFLLKKQQEIGEKAEIEVLGYEKNRLSKRPDLVNKLRHISLEEVNAGYDIKSYELNSTQSALVFRFIEVKAVSPTGYRFFWSRNEIEIAKKYQDRYFLYLLPVIGKSVFDTPNLNIIPHAYNSIFKEGDMWSIQEELYSVWRAIH